MRTMTLEAQQNNFIGSVAVIFLMCAYGSGVASRKINPLIIEITAANASRRTISQSL